MSAEALDEHLIEESIRERQISAGFLTIVICVALYDIVEDILEGESLSHITVEGTFFILAAAGSLYLWLKVKRLRSANRVLTGAVGAARRDLQQWKEKSSTLIKGLSVEIDNQFESWRLSEAEKEVGMLLLKGLSHKQIAEVRGTSEKTVRQQATTLYTKADLDGRAQLSAFFLEDLLVPV